MQAAAESDQDQDIATIFCDINTVVSLVISLVIQRFLNWSLLASLPISVILKYFYITSGSNKRDVS